MKKTVLKRILCLALLSIMAAGLFISTSAAEDNLIYSTNFANAAAISDWTFQNEGDVSFDGGGLHTKGDGRAYSPTFTWGPDGMRVVVTLKFADPNFNDAPTSFVGVARSNEEHTDYEPRLVVCGTGFQVRMEGGYGTGDHWMNDLHDFSEKPGVWSDTYIFEIIFSGRDASFAVYDKNGKAIWVRPTPNRMMFFDEFKIYLGEQNNGGQTIYSDMKVYNTSARPSGGGSAKTGDPMILFALAGLPIAGAGLTMLRKKRK